MGSDFKWKSVIESGTLEDLGTLESAERVENASAMSEECLGKSLNLNQSDGYCPAYYDGLLCWNATPLNTLAVQPCFKEFHGVQYDDTRKCHNTV